MDHVCAVEGCEGKVHSRNLCRKHYARIWRNGHAGRIYRRTDPQFLLKKAIRNYSIVVGIDGRKRWRAEIKELEQQIRDMENHQ